MSVRLWSMGGPTLTTRTGAGMIGITVGDVVTTIGTIRMSVTIADNRAS